ncbi:MAG TPA: hypothetical protein VJO32_15390 [Ktedonobacteraceae bacterium]|nr:hypothetical protein [Ktedonobacteraceae bacterium]
MRRISEPQFEDFDEHNSPTEPMSAIILSPHSVPTHPVGAGNGMVGYNFQTIPAPLPPELPFPQNGQPVAPYANLPETPGVYPILPPAPGFNGNGRPPGGATFSGDRARPLRSRSRNSSFPTFVGVLFVVAQLILLARVVLLLFGVPNSNGLVELVYAGGALLAWPLHLLLEHLNLPAQIGGDLINYLAALIAILLYGVLARILVRFLKALLNSR